MKPASFVMEKEKDEECPALNHCFSYNEISILRNWDRLISPRSFSIFSKSSLRRSTVQREYVLSLYLRLTAVDVFPMAHLLRWIIRAQIEIQSAARLRTRVKTCIVFTRWYILIAAPKGAGAFAPAGDLLSLQLLGQFELNHRRAEVDDRSRQTGYYYQYLHRVSSFRFPFR